MVCHPIHHSSNIPTNSFDDRPIKLPGGTITSKADLAERGITSIAYPSVAELEITIQDNVNSAFGAHVVKRPKSLAEYTSDSLSNTRIVYQFRWLTLVAFAYLIVSLIRKDNFIDNTWSIIGFLGICFMASPFKRLPELCYEQKTSTFLDRLSDVGLSWGAFFRFVGIAILIVVGGFVAFAGSKTEKKPDEAFIEEYIYIDVAKLLKDSGQSSTEYFKEFFKEGAKLNFKDYCFKKKCEHLDYHSLSYFKKYAVNPDTYMNDICKKIYINQNGSLPTLSNRPSEIWQNINYVKEGDYFNCALSTKYEDALKEKKENERSRLIFFLNSFLIFGMIVFIVGIIKSLKWHPVK